MEDRQAPWKVPLSHKLLLAGGTALFAAFILWNARDVFWGLVQPGKGSLLAQMHGADHCPWVISAGHLMGFRAAGLTDEEMHEKIHFLFGLPLYDPLTPEGIRKMQEGSSYVCPHSGR